MRRMAESQGSQRRPSWRHVAVFTLVVPVGEFLKWIAKEFLAETLFGMNITGWEVPYTLAAITVGIIVWRVGHRINDMTIPALLMLLSGCVFLLSLAWHLTPAVPSEDETSLASRLDGLEDSEYRDLVASTLSAFDPDADIVVGGKNLGPDGARSIDIKVRSDIDGRAAVTLFEVMDIPSGEPAGVESIDIAAAKKSDLKADYSFVISNTGFDAVAQSKATRVNVGLLSLLRQGDDRVRVVIEQEIHLRRISLHPMVFSFEEADGREDEIGAALRAHGASALTYEGISAVHWMEARAALISIDNPEVSGRVRSTYKLKQDTKFKLNDRTVVLRSMSVTFQPNVRWFSQIVHLDATEGIYDYIRGKVRLAPGAGSYSIQGVNFDEATPMAKPPDVGVFDVALGPGEIDHGFVMVEELLSGESIPMQPIEELIRPEDLDLRIVPEEDRDGRR